ncbi:MAG TPA: hypothetical protein VFJ15_05240 [Oleiagrimonas sp.]|nr:hypothetical protein [Oleiagrimonas sp.]
MSDFFWIHGHLGWGWFAVLVFTGLWWLLSDFIWRLKNIRIQRLAMVMSAGWIIGIAIILLLSLVGSLH